MLEYSAMDLGKFKVVELRAQLAARGLDQKGVKAILVSRLQAALERESLNTGTAAVVDTSAAAAAPTSGMFSPSAHVIPFPFRFDCSVIISIFKLHRTTSNWDGRNYYFFFKNSKF